MVRRVGSSVDKRASKRANHGEWLVNVSDDVVVPMTTLEVIDALRKGRLSERSLVWRIGMHDWSAIDDVPQLRLAASSRPPPAFMEPVVDSEPVTELFVAAKAESFIESAPAPTVEPEVESTELRSAGEVIPAGMPSSLAPTTAEAEAADPAAAREQWEALDTLLSTEQRADERNSRRVVLWAALGAAAMAAAFTLFIVRSPTPSPAEPSTAAEPSDARIPPTAPEPAPAAALESLPTPSASVLTRPLATPRSAPKWSARRPKRVSPIAPGSDTSATATSPTSTSETNDGAQSMAVVPAAPLQAPPTASAPSEPTPAPAQTSAPNVP